MLGLAPEGMLPRAGEIQLDWHVFAFTLAVSLLTGTVFGLAPALQTLWVDENDILKEGGGKTRAGMRRGRVGSMLVVVEIGLAITLAVGAGLLLRTFLNLRGIEPGFKADNVLTFDVSLPGVRFSTVAGMNELYRRVLERIREMPGVQGTALVNKLPLDTQFNLPFRLVGHTKNTGAAQYRVISPGYFRVMQIAVRQGRHFDDKDTAGAEPVVIVNEAFARSNFSGIEPIGQQVFVCCERWRRVVGVVSETKQRSLTEAAPAAVFIPVAQAEEGARDLLRQGSFVLRMASDPSLLSAAVIQSEVHHIDSAVPVRAVRPMEQLVSRSIASQRFNLFVLGLFAILGLLLAAVGIYSVMAYGVSQRTHEIGLRLALGAQSRDVLTLIVKQGMTPALVGLIVGLIASLSLTRSMQSLLFGVEAIDALTLAIMSLTVTIVALLACWIPARRVAKVDPMIALR